ncbi:unnamed protein product [Closterium sp. NIES-65]|nr:unnamed protein product [Closterium sp. NIES-65]
MLFQTILITRVSSQWLKNENPRYVQRLLPELVSSRILKDCWTQSRAFQNDIQASQQLHFSSSGEPTFESFVSAVHLTVGVVYCLISWALRLPKRAPIDKGMLVLLAPVAFCHALGHVMTNVSFATVAVSFTHTIKSLEPFFNAAASQFVLGQNVPLPLWMSLLPVVLGVSLASVTELSFNWTGFLTAMTSNIAFTYRNVFSKKAMVGMDSTNLYAYISILSLLYCIPPAILMEGPKLLAGGFTDAIAKVGLTKFLSDLFWVGVFYHLYNQLATNTLERVSPLTHAVGNVLKRVFVIGFSIIIFGNTISQQTGIGTAIAIAGVAAYSFLKAREQEKRAHS